MGNEVDKQLVEGTEGVDVATEAPREVEAVRGGIRRGIAKFTLALNLLSIGAIGAFGVKTVRSVDNMQANYERVLAAKDKLIEAQGRTLVNLEHVIDSQNVVIEFDDMLVGSKLLMGAGGVHYCNANELERLGMLNKLFSVLVSDLIDMKKEDFVGLLSKEGDSPKMLADVATLYDKLPKLKELSAADRVQFYCGAFNFAVKGQFLGVAAGKSSIVVSFDDGDLRDAVFADLGTLAHEYLHHDELMGPHSKDVLEGGQEGDDVIYRFGALVHNLTKGIYDRGGYACEE